MIYAIKENAPESAIHLKVVLFLLYFFSRNILKELRQELKRLKGQ